MDFALHGGGFPGFWYAFGRARVYSTIINNIFCYSSGAIVGSLVLCDVSVEDALRADTLAHMRKKILWDGLAEVVHCILEEVLPDDAHLHCSGRLHVVSAQLPWLTPKITKHWDSRADLVESIKESCHLPFISNWRLSSKGVLDGFMARGYDEMTRQCVHIWPKQVSFLLFLPVSSEQALALYKEGSHVSSQVLSH